MHVCVICHVAHFSGKPSDKALGWQTDERGFDSASALLSLQRLCLRTLSDYNCSFTMIETQSPSASPKSLVPKSVSVSESLVLKSVLVIEGLVPKSVPVSESLVPKSVPVSESLVHKSVSVSESLVPKSVSVSESPSVKPQSLVPRWEPVYRKAWRAVS